MCLRGGGRLAAHAVCEPRGVPLTETYTDANGDGIDEHSNLFVEENTMKMKFIVAACLILSLTGGCVARISPSENNFAHEHLLGYDSQNQEVPTKYYTIEEIPEDERDFDTRNEYRYYIYNADGVTVFEDETHYPPEIGLLQERYIKITVTAYMTSPVVYFGRIFDPETNRLSEWFQSPKLFYDGLVIHIVDAGDTLALEVRDIFDKSAYCEQFRQEDFDFDFIKYFQQPSIFQGAYFIDRNTLYIESLTDEYSDGTEYSYDIIKLHRPSNITEQIVPDTATYDETVEAYTPE
jgi:hypothetical protein